MVIRIISTLIICLFAFAACGPKMDKAKYDEMYQTDEKGFPEYLFFKQLTDSTIEVSFYPEDDYFNCKAPMKGVAVNKFLNRGADMEVDEHGNAIPTFRYALDNVRCETSFQVGIENQITVGTHCNNGGEACPGNAKYILKK